MRISERRSLSSWRRPRFRMRGGRISSRRAYDGRAGAGHPEALTGGSQGTSL